MSISNMKIGRAASHSHSRSARRRRKAGRNYGHNSSVTLPSASPNRAVPTSATINAKCRPNSIGARRGNNRDKEA
jgi:hypothetical protein